MSVTKVELSLALKLMLAMAIGATTQYLLSLLGPVFIQEFGFGPAQIGRLVSTVFVAAAIASVVFGRVADQLGPRRALGLLYATGAMAFLVIAVSPNQAWLFVGAVFGGISAALSNPATNQAIASRLAAGNRATVLGVKQSGVQAAGFVSGLAVPFGLTFFNWRIVVALVVIVSVAGFAVLEGQRNFHPTTASTRSVTVPVDAAATATPSHRNFKAKARQVGGGVGLAVCLYTMLMGAISGTTAAFIPLYVVEDLGETLSIAGFALSLMSLMSIIARIYWAQRIERYDEPWGILRFIAAVSIVAQLVIVLASSLRLPALFVAVMALGLTATAFNSVVMMFAIRVSEASNTIGRASGVIQLYFFSGLGLGPALFGQIVETTSSYAVVWFGLAGVAATALSITFIARRGRRVIQKERTI